MKAPLPAPVRGRARRSRSFAAALAVVAARGLLAALPPTLPWALAGSAPRAHERVGATARAAAEGGDTDYEAAFGQRLRAEQADAKKGEEKQKGGGGGGMPDLGSFMQGRAGEAGDGNNFLSKGEWNVLLAAFAFIAFCVFLIAAVKGRGY